MLALHQCHSEGNTHLHQALGPTSCSFSSARKWFPPSVRFLKGARVWEMFASPHSLRASAPCFSQCGESTQRCCTQGCCILPPSRWWSFCLGPTSGPGGAAMPVCPAARAVPCVRLARFVLLLSARESRRQAVTSCVAMLVIPAYSTGSPAQHTLWIKVRRAIEEHKSAISKKA